MKMKWTALVMALVMILTFAAGCSSKPVDVTGASGPAEKDFPLVLGSLQMEQEPERVVTLSQSLADIVLYLKMEASLVGRTEECTQADLSVLPSVGSAAGLDVEALKALNPQLVLADSSLPEEQSKALQEAGIKILVLEPATNRESLEKLYIQLGSVLKGGKTGYAKAQKSVKNVFEILDTVQREIPQSDIIVTACYLYDLDGTAVTGDMLASSLMEYAGAINIASSSTGKKIEADVLQLGNPTYIFCKPGVKEQLENSETYKNLNAVTSGNVYEMDATLMERQGKSLWSAVNFMAGKMYPELTNTMESSSQPSSEPSGDSSNSDNSSSEPASSTTSTAAGNPFPAGTVLRYGDSSDDIVKLQDRMRELGFYYKKPASGIYDDDTKRGIEDFKYRMKILDDKMQIDSETVDDKTLNALYSSDAPVRD